MRGQDLKSGLMRAMEALGSGSSSEAATPVLLRSGELECSIADSGCVPVSPFAELTDCLAEALLHGSLPSYFPNVKDAVALAATPEQVDVSAPEGFAYYALHPLAYADAVEKLPGLAQTILVIGIRSIGTTLSAMAVAAARRRGVDAKRITVRPGGHPYDRKTGFSPEERALVWKTAAAGGDFLVVDEGPGLSGSSFLSVAEALENTGADPAKIILLCSHEVDPEALCSANAPRRWRRFRHVAVNGGPRRPAEAERFVGAGQWRSLVYADESCWPESWTTMERLKYLSAAEPRRLFKFAGLGHYGEPVLVRELAVAAAGFGPAARSESGGFVSSPWLQARPMSARDLDRGVLARLAEYCAFRAKTFPAASASPAALQEMAEHDLHELKFDLPVGLRLERPVVADGRMQPHEWLFTNAGEMVKTDSGSHGDDHFFPGPTDAAWDLAGAIVEWRMDREQAEEFLELYRRASGDHAAKRTEDFIRAYAVFRCAYDTMAAQAMPAGPERVRLEMAAAEYAARLKNDAAAHAPDRVISAPSRAAAKTQP